jgi:dephospho-CoA kinase
MSITILTGPAASGKNTISKILARKEEKCAVIDVDTVRQMYVQPHNAPWDGEEGKVQQLLGVENTCVLAKNFVKNNIDVVILDVLTDEAANLYKKNLGEVKIILLMPVFAEAQRRFKERPPTITDEEFKMIYEWEENLTVFDEKIDNTALSAKETADKISAIGI